MIHKYYRLTKPGIVYGNLLPAVAGFLVASRGDVDWLLLIETISGLSLVIAGACVFNNYLDRSIDRQMERTKKRALASETLSVFNALAYGAVLLAGGSLILGLSTNTLTLAIAWLAVLMYVVVYGFFKRRSSIGTLVGAVPGAAPPVIGYTAVTNQLDATAFILFLILVLWQMPHFYSIAIYRLEDYKRARIPVLPIKYGLKMTKIQIMLYILVFTAVCALLGILGYQSTAYLIVAIPLGIYWFWLGAKNWQLKNSDKWAKQMFGFSLVVLLVISAILSLNSFIS